MTGPDFSWIDLAALATRRWRTLALGGLMGAAAAGALTVLGGRSFTSEAALIVSGGGDASGRLSGLAAQFGVAVGGGQGQSPALFADLAGTPATLEAAVRDVMADSAAPLDLNASLDLDAPDSVELVAVAARRIKNVIRIRVGRESGLLELALATADARSAQIILQAIVNRLNEAGRMAKVSQASEQRIFSEERMAAIRREVEAHEDSVRRFLTANREFRSSPALVLEYDRLQRELALKAAVLTTVAQNFEHARLEEARTTSAVVVVHAPSLAVRPDPRRLLFKALVGGIVGAFIVLAFHAVLVAKSRSPAN